MRPVVFFFGAMSPYSWFAAERIDELMPDARWCPVFAGGLFKAAGRVAWGLTDQRAAKQADCERRALRYGLGPIRWPEPWPTNDVTVARAMVVADRCGHLRPFALAAMRLAFLDGCDLGEPDAVLRAAERAGLDPREVARGVADREVKAELRARTDAAAARGVTGIPTVAVGARLLWGDDRLEDAAGLARSG